MDRERSTLSWNYFLVSILFLYSKVALHSTSTLSLSLLFIYRLYYSLCTRYSTTIHSPSTFIHYSLAIHSLSLPINFHYCLLSPSILYTRQWLHNTTSGGCSILIGYKGTTSSESSIIQTIRTPKNMKRGTRLHPMNNIDLAPGLETNKWSESTNHACRSELPTGTPFLDPTR